MQVKLHEKDALLHESKTREILVQEVLKRKSVCHEVHEMNKWIEEMSDEVSDAKQITMKVLKEAKYALTEKKKITTLATKHLWMLKELKSNIHELKDELADESQQCAALEQISMVQLQIKRQRTIGYQGGAGSWFVPVVQLICELLVNGTPPSAVRLNIQSMNASMNGCDFSELPSINFVQECQVVLQNLKETLAALCLGKSEELFQLFTDGTSCRQIAMQNLVIALREENEQFDNVIVSSCITLKDETSVNLVAGILEMVSDVSAVNVMHL